MSNRQEHQTHLYGEFQGPIHTGSGDIILGGDSIKIVLPDRTIALGPDEQIGLLADYRAYLRRRYAHLPLASIPVPLDVDLPLDRTYIKLRALPQPEMDQHPGTRLSDVLTLNDALASAHLFGEWQWQRRQEWGYDSWSIRKIQPIRPEQAIDRYEQVVILGLPGAGKTTLLHHLVFQHADDPDALLPLFIPLGRLDVLLSLTGKTFLEACLDLLTEGQTGLTRLRWQAALGAAINEWHVRFLCDGLDEVHTARSSVVDGLNDLAAVGHRLVVTSRPMGYERLAGLAHFVVLPLQPDGVRNFTSRWFTALAQVRGIPGDEQEDWATERAEWLQRQLDERLGLRELVRNPLMLTFLAVLAGDEPRRDLPRYRKDLYREYIGRLFITWESRRQREGRLVLGDLTGEKAKRIALWGLYQIAYLLHVAYYGGKVEHLPIRQQVEAALVEALTHDWDLNRLDADVVAAETLNFWQEAGLLTTYPRKGQEWLVFRHLTFQEYGAAQAFVEKYRGRPDALLEVFQPHIGDIHWSGVIPLSLGSLTMGDATSLVKYLLKADLTEDNWHRSLILIADALADGANVPDNFRKTVICELLSLVRSETVPSWLSSTRLGYSSSLAALARLKEDEYVANGLLNVVCDAEVDIEIRMQAAEALGGLGQAHEATQAYLTIAYETEFEISDRAWAAQNLSRLGKTDEAAEAYFAIAHDREVDFGYREWAARNIAGLGWIDKAVRAYLFIAHDSEVDIEDRWQVALALIGLSQIDEAAQVLLSIAQDQRMSAEDRAWSATMLVRLGRAKEASQAYFAVADDELVDFYERERAALALGELGSAEFLLNLARDKALDPELRVRVVEIISGLAQTDEIVEAYFAIARDMAIELSDRVWATRALGRLGQTLRQSFTRLEALLEDTDVPDELRHAAQTALRGENMLKKQEGTNDQE